MTAPPPLVPPPVLRARSVAALLAAVAASDPGRPRVTWYGTDGERVELSARVLGNWVAKTGNLLVEECGAEAGTTVALDLPMHWRAAVWSLASWSVGAALAPAGTAADVLVTATPGAGRSAGSVVAVALPALARRFDVDPAADAPPVWDVDYAAEVAGFADELLYAVDGDPAGVLETPALEAGWSPGSRVLLVRDRWAPVLVLRALRVDGSVVLVGDPAADLDRIAGDEQVDTLLR